MGPRQTQFWLPLKRLGVLFVAVVVAGNIVFHALRPAAADFAPGSDELSDTYARRKKRLERQIHRTMELFFGAPAGAPAKEKVGTAPAAEGSTPVVCLITAAETAPPPPIAAPAHAPAPGPRALGYIEPEPLPFSWPAPLTPPAPRMSGLPTSIELADALTVRPEWVTDLYRRTSSDPVADFGDAVLKAPELLFDGVFTVARGMSSRPATRSWDDGDGSSITSRIFDVQIGARTERIWSEFMRQWTEREVKYLGNFGDSRADTLGFENRTEDAPQHELLLDQRKVFWDALRRTYLSRYKIQADERIRDEAWYIDRWSGADYAMLPPLLGAYVFYRGIEKKFSVGGTRLLLSIEPVSEWYRPQKHDLPAAVALEWTMKDLPLGVIVSAGLHDGRYGLDFVGVGTSLGAARRALVMQELGERR